MCQASSPWFATPRTGCWSGLTGATLILYTDGLVEDRETDVDAGVAKLCSLVAGHDPALGVSTLCDRLLDELLTGPRTDDAAVLAVRISDSWGRDPAPPDSPAG